MERGSGPWLLLLHSNGGNLESWSLNIRDLSAYFHVVAIDMPGYGESAEPPDKSSIEIYGDCIMEIIRGLSCKKTHIIGNSLGGILGIDIAARYPGWVGKMVLVGTPSGESREMEKTLRLLDSWVGEDGVPRVNEEEALKITPKVNEGILKLINANLKMAAKSFMAMNRAIATFDFSSSLQKVKCPAIIIWGDQDRITSINSAWNLSRILNAQVYLVKGAGHSPQFDNPSQFNKLVLEFLLS